MSRRRGLREQRIELVEFRLRGVVVRKSSGALYLADGRIQCAVGMLRRAEIAQARVRLASEAFQQRSREPRLANAGLAGEQHHLAFAASLPLTSAAAAVRVLLRARQARSGRSRAAPRSGSRLKLGRNAAQARTGPPMPLRSCAPRSSSSKRLPSSLRVLSAMTTVFGSAMPCRRAARFGVSPTTACS